MSPLKIGLILLTHRGRPEERLGDLRSEGEQMQRDDAIAFTLDAIANLSDPV